MQAKKRVSDWSGAEQLATMCLTIDPLNEEATLTVAEAAALGGSKTKALSILNHYLDDIGDDAAAIKLPAVLLRRRISEAYQDNVFAVRDAPFVGRDEEMAELTRGLVRAQSGRGATYVIVGEPGIGKTRLIPRSSRESRRCSACTSSASNVSRTTCGGRFRYSWISFPSCSRCPARSAARRSRCSSCVG